MNLSDRIEAMHLSGIISQGTAEMLDRLRSLLRERYGIELTEQNAAGCVTHFALALERMAQGEDISPPEAEVLEDILAADDYPAAALIADDVFGRIAPLSESERSYIILHLVMVLGHIRADYDKQILAGK